MKIYYQVLASVFIVSGSADAMAYLDPGTGSLILQGLIAGLAVAGFTIKTYWYKLKSMFGKSEPGSLLEEEDQDLMKEEEQK
jgi:hypothetical protein